MTYAEYVAATLGKFNVTSSDIDFLLTESDLAGDTQVAGAEDRLKLKAAMYKVIPLMIAGLSDVSEGGYSIKWNIVGIKAWYSLLASELGEEDLLAVAVPTVRDASNRW